MSAGTSPPTPPSKLQSIFKSFTHGIIFLCNEQTKDECLHRMLFGSPAKRKDFVERFVTPQCALFLFKMSNKSDEPQMLGLFMPEGTPAMNIVPDAWAGCGSFPMQLRVRYHYKFPRPLSWENFQRFFKGRNASQSPTRGFIPCEKPILKPQLNRLLAHYLYQTYDTLIKGSPDWVFCIKHGKTIDNMRRAADGTPVKVAQRSIDGKKGLIGKSSRVSNRTVQKDKILLQRWENTEPPQQFTILPKPKLEEPKKTEPEKQEPIKLEPVQSEPKSAILRAVIKNSTSREQSERGLRNWNIRSNQEIADSGEKSEHLENGGEDDQEDGESTSPEPVPKFSILPRPGGAKPAVALPPPPERRPYSSRKSNERAVILDKYQEKPNNKRSQPPSRPKANQHPTNQKSWRNPKPDTHQVLRFSVGHASKSGKLKQKGMQHTSANRHQGHGAVSQAQKHSRDEHFNSRRPPMGSNIQQHQVDNKVLGQAHDNVVRQWQGMGGMNQLSNQLATQRLNPHPPTKPVESMISIQGQVQPLRQQLGPSVQLQNNMFKAQNYDKMSNSAQAGMWNQSGPAMRQQQPLYQTSGPVAYHQTPHQQNYQQMGVGQAMGPLPLPGILNPSQQPQKRPYQQSNVGGTVGNIPMRILPTTTFRAPNHQAGPGQHKQYTMNVSQLKSLKAQYSHQQHGMYGNEHLAAQGNVQGNTIDSPFSLPQLGMWTQSNTAELSHQGSWSTEKTHMPDGRNNNQRSFLASRQPRSEHDTFAPYSREIMDGFPKDPNKNYG